MESSFKHITNKQALFVIVKVLIGFFAFLCVFSGMDTFGAVYKAFPAILMAPLINVFENENWGERFVIKRLIPVFTSLIVIMFVFVIVFVDIPVIRSFTELHLENNENVVIMIPVIVLALYSYISLLIWKSK